MKRFAKSHMSYGRSCKCMSFHENPLGATSLIMHGEGARWQCEHDKQENFVSDINRRSIPSRRSNIVEPIRLNCWPTFSHRSLFPRQPASVKSDNDTFPFPQHRAVSGWMDDEEAEQSNFFDGKCVKGIKFICTSWWRCKLLHLSTVDAHDHSCRVLGFPRQLSSHTNTTEGVRW